MGVEDEQWDHKNQSASILPQYCMKLSLYHKERKLWYRRCISLISRLLDMQKNMRQVWWVEVVASSVFQRTILYCICLAIRFDCKLTVDGCLTLTLIGLLCLMLSYDLLRLLSFRLGLQSHWPAAELCAEFPDVKANWLVSDKSWPGVLKFSYRERELIVDFRKHPARMDRQKQWYQTFKIF